MTEYNNQQQHLQNDENENGSGLTLHSCKLCPSPGM